jgi:hypothetical protein
VADFDTARLMLGEARATAGSVRTELLRARAQRVRILRNIDQIRRTAESAGDSNIAALQAQLAAIDSDIATLQAKSDSAILIQKTSFDAFSAFSDPTVGIGQLSGNFPIALFPLRIETRFKTVDVVPPGGGPATRKHQLWVRVFPDDVLVDTFQPELSDDEVQNARTYWTHIWRAGGVVDERKSAWRALAKSAGSGRAKFIVDSYKPLNAADAPVKAAGDHVLVVVPDTPVLSAEKGAIATFWSTVWRSGGADRAAAEAALATAVGSARAAEIARTLTPVNMFDIAVTPAQVANVLVAFLDLPATASAVSSATTWTRGARSWLLPERFVLLGFNGTSKTLEKVWDPTPPELQVGPDPSAPGSEQVTADGEDLSVPDGLLWTVDFKAAVDVGMGYVADLTPEQARVGFDRLFVIGVRLASDETKGAAELATLIANHQRSRRGFTLLPQGMPTNNTDDASSGYTWWEDPDSSYRHFFETDPTNDPDDWRTRKDGAWLAGLLGIDRQVLKGSPGYFGSDQAEARAMNVALWPATLGYFMEQMMDSVFTDEAIASTRLFFNRYVIGRGALPAVRVGRQPYGILPTTVYSRHRWYAREDYASAARKGLAPYGFYMEELHALIERAAKMWDTMAAEVSFVGKPTSDPQRLLLDVIGLHPTSAEFYQRYAESLEQLYNRLKFSFFTVTGSAQEVARRYVEGGLNLLAQFGWSRGTLPPPELLDKFFLRRPNLLKGELVDATLSEAETLSVSRSDGDNYIAWLQKAARTSHNALRDQGGFDQGLPTALLYLMLHHSLDLGYVETGDLLRLNAGLIDSATLRTARKEPKFIHIAAFAADTPSRWAALYRTETAITGSPTMRVGDFIPTIIETMSPYLRTQLQALDVLKTATTAALERAFVEHIDCCSYRLDAWRTALVSCQLSFLRGEEDGKLGNPGVYVGAYGWLVDVRPKTAAANKIALDADLAATFQRPDDEPLLTDPSNRGHIHAPSLDHAVTAAVLRNGYLANATPGNPETLAVNLTSERVRLAMQVIEGIRNGQPLGALLGYQLERSLHDSDDLYLDRLIFGLRKKFPLAGNRIASTTADVTSITQVEARNVVDGLAFIEHLERTGQRTYPYGVGGLPRLTDLVGTSALTASEIGKAIDARVERMRNTNDAVADVAVAESVFQVVKGNYDRAAGTLDAFSKGNFPPTPEVALTPRSGRTLVHRVALHLEGGLDPASPANRTPRAKGEPALNAWLAKHLPPMAEIFAAVARSDAAAGTPPLLVSMADLGLEPIDLFYLVDEAGARAVPGLDAFLIHHSMRQSGSTPRADAVLTLAYKPTVTSGFTVFEVAPLLRSLRGMILGSRPLKATDISLASEATAGADAAIVARPDKVTAVIADLQAKSPAMQTFAATLATAVAPTPDETIPTASALANIDQWSADYADALRQIAPFGLRAASLTAAYEQTRPVFAKLHEATRALVARWEAMRQEFIEALATYDALPASTMDDERFRLLIDAGRLISTAVIAPLPAAPADLRLALNPLQTAFDADLNSLRAIRANANKLGAYFAAVQAFAPKVAEHDHNPLDLTEYPRAILAIARDLAARAEAVKADVTDRLDSAAKILGAVAAAPADKQPERVSAAMHAILGEGFVTLPEFTLAPERLAEWQNAWTARDTLLTHLTTGADATPFPVDDWLHGLGRVREKLRHVEMAGLLGEALSAPQTVNLVPVQFPYRANDAWLGLKFPATMPDGSPFRVDSDRLLYTAHFGDGAGIAPADPARRYCGILIDEWSELIPTETENTGLAFHYDRPSSEAPQSILLVTSPTSNGPWTWNDLVDALNETLDFARLRAVEPSQIDKTELSRFLPSVISAVTMFPLTAALNFSDNNGLRAHLGALIDD